MTETDIVSIESGESSNDSFQTASSTMRKPSGGSSKYDEYSLTFFSERSRVQHLDHATVFYFDYKKPAESKENIKATGNRENINWKVLRDLKHDKKWEVIRHPMVLNFINERLLDCALFYTLHIFAFGLFLLLLSSHIFSRTCFKNCAVTVFLLIFTFFAITKAAVKRYQSIKCVSFWFVVAYAFNFLTYLATFCYVWLPTYSGYDNYHQEIKTAIIGFSPIIATISAWLNFLYILRKSPYGIYIFMMVRILRSFGHIATIWIPTLIAFSFAFHLIMRDSGVEPWENVDKNTNSTMVTTLFVILQAITKTSTMMIGEIDANDILGKRQWIPSILVLAFEVITVILLMNLMVSLAVGDVSDLRNTAQDKLLQTKVNFVIEALKLSKMYSVFKLCDLRPALGIIPLHKRQTNNVLVVDSEGEYHSFFREDVSNIFEESEKRGIGLDKLFKVNLLNSGMKIRLQSGRPQSVFLKNCAVELIETTDSGIAPAPPGIEPVNIHVGYSYFKSYFTFRAKTVCSDATVNG